MTDPRSNSAGTIRHKGERIRIKIKVMPGVIRPTVTATGGRRR
jgi:hypothetical protein